MSTFHGDCIGPVGAKLWHSVCPHTWTSQFTGRTHVCECWCHERATEGSQTPVNAVSRPELDTSEGFPGSDSHALTEALSA